MAGKIFTLEALEAKHGDALILHYGHPEAPGFIVIDGGPPGTYAQTMRPRLDAIRARRGSGLLEIRMVMVSHIDGDHIDGVLRLISELKNDQDMGRPLSFDILTLWHNSFDDLVGPVVAAEVAKMAAELARSHAAGAAIAASVGQGRQLRIDADALAINMNSGFEDLIHFNLSKKPLKISPGLVFTVLGPRKRELDALKEKWVKELPKILAKEKKDGKPAAVAEFADRSVHNLSSLIVLVEADNKKILLTGDARGDFIIDSLKEARLLKNGRLDVDIVKVPHHGSRRNVASEFFRTVHARHYVFSADGKYGNPDPGTFEDLFEARPKGPYELWLTNDVPAVKRINAKKPSGVVLHVRTFTEPSVKIELGDKIRW